MIDTGTNELLCEVKNGVAVLTLNRPEKRNSLSDVLTPALREMVQKLDERSDVRCLVITGEGGSFCAGGDLGGMSGGQLVTGVESFDDNVSAIVGFLDTLFAICSVNEFFVGSGVIGFNILADLLVLSILIYNL